MTNINYNPIIISDYIEYKWITLFSKKVDIGRMDLKTHDQTSCCLKDTHFRLIGRKEYLYQAKKNLIYTITMEN
jgi:hypothetical protein